MLFSRSLWDFGEFLHIHAKIPINGAPWAVCKEKNRLIGDFWRFYARSATNC
jgi:hypothetical protein